MVRTGVRPRRSARIEPLLPMPPAAGVVEARKAGTSLSRSPTLTVARCSRVAAPMVVVGVGAE
jgi:hypothetical protein